MSAKISAFKQGDRVRIKFAHNRDGQRFLNVLFNAESNMSKDTTVIMATIMDGFDNEDTWDFELAEDGSEFSGLDTRGAVSITRL